MNAEASDMGRAMRRFAGGARLLLCLCAVAALFAGCDLRPNRIGVSNTLIDFGLNETPFPLYVWNSFSRIPMVQISAESDSEWIQVSPSLVESLFRSDAGFDKRAMIVRINRSLLDVGEHKGYITLKSFALRPQKIEVRVRMDVDGRPAGMEIKEPTSSYATPYLLDFAFSLRDGENKAVIAEPAQFTVAAFEDGVAVNPMEAGLALHTAPARQLLLDLVLDYSLTMQRAVGALQSMEEVARNSIVRLLHPDAAVGITVFSRDDRPPDVVSDFTLDHARIRELLAEVRLRHTGRFASGATLFDALMDSLDKFDEGRLDLGFLGDRFDTVLEVLERFGNNNPLRQSRHIFVITDGYDVSSVATLNDVIRLARNLFVHINVVGMGAKPNLAVLLPLAGQTGGAYFSYEDEKDGIAPHVQDIIQILEGQYRLRWATMSRRNHDITPGFHIAIAGKSAQHIAIKKLNPTKIAGDTLRGVLDAVQHDDGLRSAVHVNAEYVPRFVYDMRFTVTATHPFDVVVQETADGGLLGHWTLQATRDNPRHADLYFYNLTEALPFAGYGTLFMLDFGEVLAQERPAVSTLEIDNSLYEDTVFFEFKEE